MANHCLSMQLSLILVLCLSSCYAVKEEYAGSEGGNLQSDIQEYLRRLTQQRQMYPAQNMQPVLDTMLPYPSMRLPQYTPPGGVAEEVYANAHASATVGNEERPLQQWPRLLQQNPTGGARAYAASSVHIMKPNPGTAGQVDTKAEAYSSVRDVDAEEHLDENKVSTGQAAEKKSPKPVQQTVSDPLARKSEPSTAQMQNTETTVADNNAFNDVYFVAIVAGCSAAGIFGVISAGICFYRIQKSTKAAAEVDYPAYGVTGPSKDATSPNGDRKLAQSAQMYHYQHQKQQMIAVEKAGSTKNTSASDVDSEEENEEGDYTVYECPGLAPTGEMEVKNPLFNDDSTPMTPSALPTKPEGIQSK